VDSRELVAYCSEDPAGMMAEPSCVPSGWYSWPVRARRVSEKSRYTSGGIACRYKQAGTSIDRDVRVDGKGGRCGRGGGDSDVGGHHVPLDGARDKTCSATGIELK